LLLLAGMFARLRRSRADDRHLAHYVEEHIPDFEQRLLTSLEFSDEELQHGRRGVSQQFIQQLWEDAQRHVQAQQHEVETVMPAGRSWLSLGSAVTALLVTTALLFSSEGLFQSSGR